jgi:hypothetical protein
MLVITYLGNTYIFYKKDETETDAMFRDRCWWIVKNSTNCEIDLKMIISLSSIWTSIKYYGATYDEDVANTITTLNDVYVKK